MEINEAHTSGGTFHPDHKTRARRRLWFYYIAFLREDALDLKQLQSPAPCEQFLASQSVFKTTVISVIYYCLDFEQN